MTALLFVLLCDVTSVRSLSAEVTIELFTEAPQIVTPTGVAVAEDGTLIVAESNTHFEPEGYDRHPSDRLLAWPSGKQGEPIVFADGFRRTMSLLVRPSWIPPVKRGSLTGKGVQLYAATRSEIWLLEDRDGDWVADAREILVRHETKGDYPHNGLAGLVMHPSGRLIFGQGENLGEPYTVLGSDGSKHTGGGEGGNVYQSEPDGSAVELFATGYWNPYASTVDSLGNIFTVDNDPDSRPPCRLLHTVRGGDFGYRFENGRKGLHPLTAWDGELPGTLPMVAGTGEAPSGVLFWDASSIFEAEETLLVTSWGDHRIDAYTLEPRGASYSATAKPLIVGGSDFRPVAIAAAPGGVAYVTDWVSRSYPVHGEGRIWKLTFANAGRSTPEAMLEAAKRVADGGSALEYARSQPGRPGFAAGLWTAARTGELFAAGLTALDRTAASAGPWLKGTDTAALAGLVASDAVPAEVAQLWMNQFEFGPPYATPAQRSRAAARIAARLDPAAAPLDLDQVARFVELSDDRFALNAWAKALAATTPAEARRERIDRDRTTDRFARVLLLSLERSGDLTDDDLRSALRSDDAEQPIIAMRAIADGDRAELRDDLLAVTRSSKVTKQLLRTALAVLHDLDGGSPADFERLPPSKIAGELVADESLPAPARAAALSLLPADDPFITSERLRAWLQSDEPALQSIAARHLRDRSSVPDLARETATGNAEAEIRVNAVSALSPGDDAAVLRRLTKDDDLDVASAASRILRWTGSSPNADVTPANRVLAGEQIFFHPQGPACGRCHTYDGRGGDVGPDLTRISQAMDRDALLRAITHPSEHVAPQWTPWVVVLNDGRVEAGLIHKDNDREIELVRADGTRLMIPKSDIEDQQIGEVSVMPDKLLEKLTADETQYLLDFLTAGGYE